jgi:hypothetical protein
MTPKEKAKDLIDKFSTRLKVLNELEGWVEHIDSSKAKGHALTAVDEILFVLEFNLDFRMERSIGYFLEVKQEIQNL